MRTAGQGPGGFEKREGFMKPGQDIVMAGFTGFAGTCRIGQIKREELLKRFPSTFLSDLDQREGFSVEQWMEGELLREEYSVTAHEYAGEGGILAALWNLSGIYHGGVSVDLRSLPMRQITVEVCELYGLNPYRLLCSNCALMVTDNGGRLAGCLMAEGIPASVAGTVEKGIARQIRHGGEESGYLERPMPDELLKITGLAQRIEKV